MHGEFDPLGALLVIALLAVGGFAVTTFFRQAQPGIWHWVSLIVGIVMVALGTMLIFLAAWTFLATGRQ